MPVAGDPHTCLLFEHSAAEKLAATFFAAKPVTEVSITAVPANALLAA